MIDTNDRIWIFGDSSCCQIGDHDGLEENVSTSKELVLSRGRQIDAIKCGLTHCYLRCDDMKTH